VFSGCSFRLFVLIILFARTTLMEEFMTSEATPEDNVLLNVGETVGATAGKAVAAAKRTATAIGEEKERLAGVATQARSEARRVFKKAKKEAKRAAKSAKKVVASAKKSVKRVARKLKRKRR
jgi:hypothetical protein